MLFNKYYPFEYVEDVFSIDYAKLFAMGYRGLIFDIDNTLVLHGADSTPAVDQLFREIHQAGLKTILLSNNSEKRILRFKANIDTPFICDADKPNPSAFDRAVAVLGCDKSEVLVIGDQVFTDICGANSSGIASILVKYIGYYKKEKKGIHRNIEKIILFFYSKSRYTNRLGNIIK